MLLLPLFESEFACTLPTPVCPLSPDTEETALREGVGVADPVGLTTFTTAICSGPPDEGLGVEEAVESSDPSDEDSADAPDAADVLAPLSRLVVRDRRARAEPSAARIALTTASE